jgi:hypothetical protein
VTPPFPRALSGGPLLVVSNASDDVQCCGENRQLRQEYIEELAAFNAAAARHRLAIRVGMQGPSFESSWAKFQERCASSREAWARYRKHVSAHGCRRA